MISHCCLVLGQINTIVGDVLGNVKKVIDAAEHARDELNADLVVFPELTLTGYPPEDLLHRPDFIKRVELGLEKLKKDLYGITIVIGHPSGQVREDLYNAASVIVDGQCLITYFKQYLPNYSVFDEERYFVKGNSPGIFECKGIKFGITVCEDIWFKDPTNQAADHGAEVLLNLNASPYRQGKCQLREVEVRRRVAESGLPIVYVNQVGGQDELVFDGGSFVISANGQKVARAPAWREGLFPVNITREQDGQLNLVGEVVAKESDLEMIYRGLVVGLRDYIEKNDFPSVVIGLSGGIDSAMTLALAVDALGSDRVKTVMMPSKYTSQMSLDDAAEMASLLNVTHSIIPIDPITDQFNTSLLDHFYGLPADITEENIQARSRGVLLMALSNKTGAMVLSTGNKSEMAVGYSTLYGDMAGGFSPLKDVYKSLVYRLADYRNNLAEIIPTRIITRPPSAELADEQLDQDSLPAYEILDVLLEQYIANDLCYEEMVSIGNDPELIAQVIRLVDRNEYKRRQAPPGIRITDRAFGRDRRYPITSGYTINSKME
jgi:NAD+ synthase (glutamine-hydrolysing)|tara:strand:- start:210 stop:1853 length:1644 start_codon:yes stop_codon:yes gene_type:complete